MSTVALSLAVSLALPLAQGATTPAEGLERSKAVVQAFLKVPAKPGPARDQAFAALDGFLDLDGMVAAAIAPRKDKLTPAELKRFQSRFRELLRLVAYTDSGEFFRTAKLTWGAGKPDGEDALVPTQVSVPKEDLETDLEWRWRKVGGAVKLVDVNFEGDSLVKDYQNQIARIVDKNGAAGLLKVIDEKWAELTGGKK
jgi:ABC-type transporter MlaC component